MTAKRIILLLDGTWNDADTGPFDTNIVRLRDLIARTLAQTTESAPVVPESEVVSGSYGTKIASGFTAAGLENYVFYERGVGTGFLDQFRGGIFGTGLPDNVRRAYKFLSRWYEPGDQVFVFGFSRGAFTARSLVGYIAAAGLLTRSSCTPENEILAWTYYRTSPGDRLPGLYEQLSEYVHDRDKLRISCVGVFDTVGALGIPSDWAWRINRARYEFHDVELSSITHVNLHAIAVDEHRKPFQTAVWRKPKFRRYTSHTEQVWFPGAHADIGGGYVAADSRSTTGPRALDDIALDWMIKRVRTYFPDFPSRALTEGVDSRWSCATQHEPRKWVYRLAPFALRSIANRDPEPRKWHHECGVSRDRNVEPIGEMVHIAALDRLGQLVYTDRRARRYRPANLIAVLPLIADTYTDPPPKVPRGPAIPVVDWSGKVLRAKDTSDLARVQSAITTARQRLGL